MSEVPLCVDPAGLPGRENARTRYSHLRLTLAADIGSCPSRPGSQVYIDDLCSRPRRARPETVFTLTVLAVLKGPVTGYRGTALIRNSPPPRTTVGP